MILDTATRGMILQSVAGNYAARAAARSWLAQLDEIQALPERKV